MSKIDLNVIWDALHEYRENNIPEGNPEHDDKWSDICTQMAWISEDLNARGVYTETEVQDIADEALNAACRVVQERLGVPNGDLAALYFQGRTERVITDILRGYIRTEIQEGDTQ